MMPLISINIQRPLSKPSNRVTSSPCFSTASLTDRAMACTCRSLLPSQMTKKSAISDTSLMSSTLISSAFLSSAAFTTTCNNSSNFKIRPPVLTYLLVRYKYEYCQDKVSLFSLINTYLFYALPSRRHALNLFEPCPERLPTLESLELALYNLLQKQPCQYHSYKVYLLYDNKWHQSQLDL